MNPLGFIIISYNRPDDTLELLQNIETLDKASELLHEVIVLNNASMVDYSVVKNYIASSKSVIFKYFDSPENLGVARGRNYALAKSEASVLIMLDDDAILQNKDCLVNLVREFELKNTERPKAIVSFKVLYFDTLEMQVNALPHKRFHEFKDLSFFETYYYAGGAHAIKRDVLEKVGNYPVDFFYGMEEYDFSYRILDAGYSIVYSDKIIMLHKESPLGRSSKKEKIRMMWMNKAKVAYRYLPMHFFYSTSFLWSLQYLKLSGFDLKGFIYGWKEILRIPKTETRKPISSSTLKYLKKLKARLSY